MNNLVSIQKSSSFQRHTYERHSNFYTQTSPETFSFWTFKVQCTHTEIWGKTILVHFVDIYKHLM